MKSNKEIRDEARAVVKGKWFWRILTAGLTLYIIGETVLNLVAHAYKALEIQTFTNFLMAKAQAIRGGLDLTLPSRAVGLNMMGASAFELFISYIFAAILAFGFASVTLKAIRDEEKAWFSDAFAGYRRPLDLFWLMLVMNLFVTLWTLLFIIPGFIAIYRYRQAWYLKVENPDWGVVKCLGESSRLMSGHKAEAFSLDAWFFCVWFVPMAFFLGFSVAAMSFSRIGHLLGGVAFLAGMVTFVKVLCFYFTARTIFYREVKEAASGRVGVPPPTAPLETA